MLTVFETILEMSLTASIVILVVMLARMLLSKAPKKYAYLLWLVVAFRLCVPFSFESSISIFNTADAIPTFDTEASTQETSSETSSETVSESVSAPEVSDEISIPSVPVIPN
ncbi:MAG: peptidase M56, partial [Clostridia bacterium]|nr:peptidase M56 [Clostridia bacterium]